MRIVQHEDNCGPGRLGDEWRRIGVALDVVEAWHQPLPDTLDGVDALCVLGGSMNADADAECPWLPGTRRLIADALAAHVPFLGVCLGTQLATLALGGTLRRLPQLALGLHPMQPTAEAAADPLFAVLGADAGAVHYNRDAIEVPAPGATTLAHAPDGHIQAQRFGARAWGVQFHPEATDAGFREWTVDKPHERRPVPPQGPLADVVAAVDAAEADLDRRWRAFARRFAELARHPG